MRLLRIGESGAAGGSGPVTQAEKALWSPRTGGNAVTGDEITLRIAPMTNDPADQSESRRILERVAHDSSGGLVGASVMARAVERSKNHLAAGDADQDDAIEVWGTRIGRVLGLLFVAGLAVWLILHLFRG